jgi:hypothetical protein
LLSLPQIHQVRLNGWITSSIKKIPIKTGADIFTTGLILFLG